MFSTRDVCSNERSLSGDGSHTGEVVLCWGLVD